MAVKPNRIAYGVRVVLNDMYETKCMGDEYLKDEKVLFIGEEKSYNDIRGEYVYIKGGSLTTSGIAYLDELNLEFEVPDSPMYELYPATK